MFVWEGGGKGALCVYKCVASVCANRNDGGPACVKVTDTAR